MHILFVTIFVINDECNCTINNYIVYSLLRKYHNGQYSTDPFVLGPVT